MHRVLAVLLVVLVGMGGVGGVVAVEADEATAERAVETTSVSAGETVEVTVTVDLPAAATVDYVEAFEPAFADAGNPSFISNGEPAAPILQEFDGQAAVVAMPELESGTLEITYEVTVPDDAVQDAVYTFDGVIQVDGTEVPIDGDATLTVTDGVVPPASFAVDIDGVGTDESVTAGDELTVAATVENTGGQAGTQSVTFAVDGTERGSESVSLDAGETETVTFDHETAVDDPPSIDIEVASENDSATTTIAVEGAEPTGDGTGDDGVDDSDGLATGFGVGAVLLAALALVAWRARHRRATGSE